MKRGLVSAVAGAIVGVACSAFAQHGFEVLVFSKTLGYRHPSIPNGIAMVEALGEANDFGVDTTEDSGFFNDATLSNYAAIVFLSTTGDILDPSQQEAFQRYIERGGGFVGIHATSDTERTWPWFGELIGAYFRSHPSIQPATTLVLDRSHPSTRMLPERWIRTDECYNYTGNPRGRVHVLATLDESTYSGGQMGYDHPIAWCHEYEGGRVWYTGGGHTKTSYDEPLFREHVLGGILWAAGQQYGDAGATIDASFDRVTLEADLRYAMGLAVADDGRVFYIKRTGQFLIWKPDTQSSVTAATLPVWTEHEDGLTGLALDPGFSTNHWLYLMYSPDDEDLRRVSRFCLVEDHLDLASEVVLLTIPGPRGCCHAGGNLEFGPDGTLYIPVGDDTDPYQAGGYTPIDERPGRERWDAQKSAGNANDLRGKILRIRPQPDGTYTIPPGNLFPVGTPDTRPEVYVMGCRNPFRISVDSESGWLYWGDVGPDAKANSALRGPRGYDEFNQTRQAGNFGWPYAIADNQPYRDFDFASSTPGDFFDPAAPVNDSPNNTGPLALPPARPAWIWYPYGQSAQFPVMNEAGGTGARCAMVGPVFHWKPEYSPRGLPPYFDNTVLVFDRTRQLIVAVRLDGLGDILAMHPFLFSVTTNGGLSNVLDLEVGPDGSLYSLGYAEHNRENIDLVRLDYLVGDSAPVAVASASPDNGALPLRVSFSSAGSQDPDPGDSVHYAWSFFGDGTTNSTEPNPTFVYSTPGRYTPQLRVYDQAGNECAANLEITVGNHRPVVRIAWPPQGSIYDWGEALRFHGSADDLEDGETPQDGIECDEIQWELSLGHNNDHEHSLVQLHGCDGVVDTPLGHGDGGDYLFLTLLAAYEDHGADGVPPLSDEVQITLQPRRKEAEHYTSATGVTTVPSTDEDGRADVAGVDRGDSIHFFPVNFTNIDAIALRLAAASPGSRVEFRLDSTNGTLLASADLPVSATGYTNLVVPITDPGGPHELVLLFLNESSPANLCRLNWLEFQGPGVTVDQTPFLGRAAVVPGIVEIEQFDEGGNGVSYLDETPGNLGAVYRATDVDLMRVPHSGCTGQRAERSCVECRRGVRNYAAFATRDGEWLEYTVQVETQGVYEVDFNVVAVGGGGRFRLEVEQADLTGPLAVPGLASRARGQPHGAAGWRRPTADPGPWDPVVATNVLLAAGKQILRLQMLDDGTFGTVGVFDRMEFRLVKALGPGPLQESAIAGIIAEPPILQWCTGPGGTFQDAPKALVNATQQSITIDRPSGSCFFRLRADRSLRISEIELGETQLRITYE